MQVSCFLYTSFVLLTETLFPQREGSLVYYLPFLIPHSLHYSDSCEKCLYYNPSGYHSPIKTFPLGTGQRLEIFLWLKIHIAIKQFMLSKAKSLKYFLFC